MQRDLEDALNRVGWDALYERHIPGLRNESANGERIARSPFPFSDDHTASFSVNMRSGLWQCWHSAGLTGIQGGNYVQFVALMNARTGADGRPAPDFSEAERNLRIELGLSRPVDPAWLAECQASLAHSDSDGHRAWIGHKPWDTATLVRLGVGWDAGRQRFVIPVADADGRVQNTRLYRPHAVPKIMWSAIGLGDNYLFPFLARRESWVVLVEGEADVISLRAFGYNACSGTMGSGNPVPPGMWWTGKQVFVWMDVDAPGREAEGVCARIVGDGASDVRIVALPEWEGRPVNADASDWIMHLLRQGMAPEQVQREISRLLAEASVAETSRTAYDAVPKKVEFNHALTAENAGVKIEFAVHVLGKSSQVFSLPVRVNVTCPARGHTFCQNCMMNTQHHGDAVINMDPRSDMSLKLIRAKDTERDTAIKYHMHIPARCPDPRISVLQSADVQVAMLGTTLVECESIVASDVDRRRHEGLIIVPPKARLDENVDYKVNGFVYPLPTSQQQVFLLDRFERITSKHDQFDNCPETRDALSAFKPAAGVFESLLKVAQDLESAHTLIRGRPDLHVMYRSVWHSVIAFRFSGATYRRGWLEALVVGDTRCGKSDTFKKMAAVFETGVLVDCKMQTAAGMLGSVEQSMSTGERFVIAGMFPQQDGVGPICMDEFSASRHDRRNIMDIMSSTRAEGMVSITKAAHARFLARCRLIMLANPGVGKLVHEIGGFGVEIISTLIDQPEDIARFDVAMCVSQRDVTPSIINVSTPPTTPFWTVEMHRLLLAWTWSRKPHQVTWADGAEQSVLQTAVNMCAKYDAKVPLVEPADQRMRVAKLAVSIAAQCYSTDATGELIIVKTEHVYAAAVLFSMWYDKPAFGYDRFSAAQAEERVIVDEGAVTALLDRLLMPAPALYAEKIIRLITFNEKVLATITPMPYQDVRGFMQELMANRCIRLERRKLDSYELTPAFVNYLQRYITARKARQ